MNVIVFASRKGGSGKSTLAAHLAAQVHKATKPCLLIDADPQGSLTLWHKLRGTNEPAIKTAVNSVSGIIAQAKRDGIEWVFIDTPPNLSAVVDDSIKNATSILDYIFRELAVSYLDRTDLAHVKPQGASFDDLGRGEVPDLFHVPGGRAVGCPSRVWNERERELLRKRTPGGRAPWSAGGRRVRPGRWR